MEEDVVADKIAMHTTRGCLVVPLTAELYEETIPVIQGAVLERVNSTGIKSVILDVSAIDIIDALAAQGIADTARMVSMLGAVTAIVGIQPGVATSLVDLDCDFQGIHTVLTLDEAFRLLEPELKQEESLEDIEEPAEDILLHPDEDEDDHQNIQDEAQTQRD